ncbi:MAG TPA: 50S ribosomal protein L9 [Rubrobacter sp.]|nr:50S ribosomal protein L9 [Rubrobacter sp.]
MKVILLSDQRNLGKRGETVEVKPGYGRNYLLPQGMALEATQGNQKLFEQRRVKIDAEHAKERGAAEEVKGRIEALRIEIPKRVGERDTLYGSVTSGDIAEALQAKGVTVDRRRIQLEGGIKSLGDHKVQIDLHSEVMAEVTVAVVREE